MKWAWIILVASGCLEPTLVPCGELSCAPAQVCHADRCLDPSQLEACAAPIEQGAACDAFGEPGRCIDGVCELATCGDGYVDEELREECDSSVPEAQCIDFGYDMGRPACTECQPDETIGCVRFGWQRLVDAPTTNLWVDGDTLAYLTTMGLTVRTPTTTTVVPGFFSNVHAAAGHVIAFHQTAFVDVVNGTASEKTLRSIQHARVGPDGRIYALENCTVSTITNTLTAIGPAVNDQVCGLIEVGPPTAAGPRIYVAAGTPYPRRIYRWDSGRGQFVTATGPQSQITSMRFHGDRLWVTTTGNPYTVDDNNQVEYFDIGFGADAVSFTDDAVVFSDSSGTAARMRGTRIQRFRAPGLITGDGAVYSYRGPIYRFTGIDYGSRAPLSSQLEVVSAVQPADGSVIVATKRAFHTANATGDGWSQSVNPSAVTRAFTGDGDRFFVSDFSSQPGQRNSMLYTASGGIDGTWIPVTVPTTPLVYGLWWASADSTLFAVGDNDMGDAFLGVRRGTTMWEVAYRTGCTVRGVHGTDSSHVIAVGRCGDESVVWTYDGTQWTELARPALAPPLLAALRLPDGTLFVTGDGGTARFDGATWTIDPDVIGSWLSATSNTDVWVSGAFTSVQHFDGTVWSKLAVQASGPITVTAAPDRVLFPGATEDFVELIR